MVPRKSGIHWRAIVCVLYVHNVFMVLSSISFNLFLFKISYYDC